MNCKIIAITLIVLLSPVAFAHSGGTNKYGCHAGTKKYHCHGSSSASSSSSSGSDFSGADAGAVVAGLLGAYFIAQQVSHSQVVEHPKQKPTKK